MLEVLGASNLRPILFILVRDFPKHQNEGQKYFEAEPQAAEKAVSETGRIGQLLLTYGNRRVALVDNLEKIAVREEKVHVMDEIKNAILKSLQKIVDQKMFNKKSVIEFFKHYNDAVEIQHIEGVKNKIM